MISMLVALAVLAAEPATPAPPVDVASAEVPGETKKQRDRRLREAALNTVVCKDMVLTGTNFHSNVCRTQRQWNAEQQAAQRASTRFQQEGMRSLRLGAH